MFMQFVRRYALPLVVSVSLVILVDALTNAATEKYFFDSNFYLGIAERGFETDLLVAPFVYRYGAPLLAGALHHFSGLSIYKSFKLLTYIGLISQLFGVFLIVHHLTHSRKSAYVGMLVVAFSMYNLKYLLFDVYRVDSLGYAIILLCAWFALKGQFFRLLLITMLGLQVREFVAVPLLAFVVAQLWQGGVGKSLRYILISLAGLFIAGGLPRLLIPVVGNEQAVKFSLEGIQQLLNLLLLWRRDINLVYVCFAYFLPVLIFYRPSKQKKIKRGLSSEHLLFFLSYMGFILLLIIVGGTDMERFASYFFLPMAVFVGFLVVNQSLISIFVMIFLQFIFNRVWLLFPIWDYDLFASFYGGWSNVITPTTIWRYIEVATYAVLGNLIVHLNYREPRTQSVEIQKKV
jgi:hypothetical protein